MAVTTADGIAKMEQLAQDQMLMQVAGASFSANSTMGNVAFSAQTTNDSIVASGTQRVFDEVKQQARGR